MGVKVSKSLGLFKKYEWRGEISRCPHCRQEPKESPYTEWYDAAWVVWVVLRPDIPKSKTQSCAVFSACPTCKKISWTHHDLDSSYGDYTQESKWGDGVVAAMLEERARRIQKCMVEFEKSLCLRCALLTDINLRHIHPSISCPRGGWHVTDECDKFKPRR